jgi:hypothetical protein
MAVESATAAAPAEPGRVSFGVSFPRAAMDQMEGRLALIRARGFQLSRSNYLALLLKYDAEHHTIETILGAPSPPG